MRSCPPVGPRVCAHALLLGGVLWSGGLVVGCSPTPKRARGPLDQGAWVWQRSWTPAVTEAVASSDFDRLMVLAVEVDWTTEGPRTHRVALPETLPKSTGLVVRMEAPPEGVDPSGLLVSLVEELWSAHPEAAGVQLDIDVPTRRLGDYTGWVDAVRPALAGRFLEVTTLPTWLDAPQLADLAGRVDHTVLQVHWLDPSDPTHLLDPAAAAHVERMAALGRPFRVGLPACGYAVALDAAGGFAGVAAEQGTPVAPPGGQVVELLPDTSAVAALVRTWTRDRPEDLAGLMWFRLPTIQDRRAWPPQTLAAVRDGRTPVAVPRVVLRAPSAATAPGRGPLDVVLVNDGDAPLQPPVVRIDAAVEMADGVGGYAWSAPRGLFLPGPRALPLLPSSELVIGWLRTSDTAAEPPHAAINPTPPRSTDPTADP